MLQNFAARMVGRVNRNLLAGIGLLLISFTGLALAHGGVGCAEIAGRRRRLSRRLPVRCRRENLLERDASLFCIHDFSNECSRRRTGLSLVVWR